MVGEAWRHGEWASSAIPASGAVSGGGGEEPMNEGTAISASGLVKAFAKTRALNGLDLSPFNQVPSEDLTAAPLIWLTAVAAT